MMFSKNLTVDPLEMNNSFRKFSEHLYRSESPQSSEEQDTSHDQFQYQTLTDEARKELDNGLKTDNLN